MGAEGSKSSGPLVLKAEDLAADEAPTAYSDGDLVDQEEGGYTEEQNDPKAVVIVPAVLMTVYEKVPLRMADGTVTEPLWCLKPFGELYEDGQSGSVARPSGKEPVVLVSMPWSPWVFRLGYIYLGKFHHDRALFSLTGKNGENKGNHLPKWL